MSEHLPIFVYGTLLDGYKNSAAVLRGRHTSSTNASLSGARLWHYAAGFPGMEATVEAATVKGAIIHIPFAIYFDVLRDLDGLEDYFGPKDARNVYERKIVLIDVEGMSERVKAYTYFTLMDSKKENAELVLSGDWRAFMLERKLDDAGDDWAARQAAALLVVQK